MIKTIIFDNVGVFTPAYYIHSVKRIAGYLGISLDKLQPIWDKYAINIDKGGCTTEEFLKTVLEELGIEKNIDEFTEFFLDGFCQIPEMREFALTLSDDFDLIMLTNFGDCFNECNKEWRLQEIFGDKIEVSYKLKMIKPNKDIFEYTFKKYNLKPNETIFIDDNKDNIKTAIEIGMNAIHFESLDQLKKDLVKYITI